MPVNEGPLEMAVNEGPMQRARELAVFEFDRRITA